MDQKQEKEAWHQAVMWYGVGMLPALRRMTSSQRQKLLSEVRAVMMSNPVHMCREKQFLIPSWSRGKLTGGQIAALAVYGLWVHVGEIEDLVRGLLGNWPEIKDACALASLISVSSRRDGARP
jgi:hypothetical protein